MKLYSAFIPLRLQRNSYKFCDTRYNYEYLMQKTDHNFRVFVSVRMSFCGIKYATWVSTQNIFQMHVSAKKNNISKITIRWAGSLVLFSVAYATGLEIERAEVDRMSRLKFLMKLVQHRHWRDKLVPKFTFSCWTKYHKNSLLPGSGTKVLSLLGQSRLVTLRWPGEDQRVSLSAFHFQT